ncbi:hypothetical protein NDU88_001548 [Pleurodeles waltl]|uniref:Uncharacterized protein n=1 Tax=Pleurodeles waltl TaxID=8319 RepID=A0AAV7TIM0_PLEWA|nr:hypothetical protein NDU88_001548 [Pleurodeles waltl]
MVMCMRANKSLGARQDGGQRCPARGGTGLSAEHPESRHWALWLLKLPLDRGSLPQQHVAQAPQQGLRSPHRADSYRLDGRLGVVETLGVTGDHRCRTRCAARPVRRALSPRRPRASDVTKWPSRLASGTRKAGPLRAGCPAAEKEHRSGSGGRLQPRQDPRGQEANLVFPRCGEREAASPVRRALSPCWARTSAGAEQSPALPRIIGPGGVEEAVPLRAGHPATGEALRASNRGSFEPR